MTGNIVKLVFQSIAQGSGIEKASQDTAALRKNLNMAGHAANLLGQAFGDIGHLAGGAISAIATGNFWQLGAMACGKLVSVVKEHNKLMADARLAARGLSREYMSVEAAAKGYQKRVEQWRKAKAKQDEAERKADEERKNAKQKARDTETARIEFQRKYYDLEQKISEEKRKAAAASESDLEKLKAKIAFLREEAALAVRNAKDNVSFAQSHGSAYEKDTSAKELELAQAREKTVAAETDKMMADFNKAEKEKAFKREKEEMAFAEFVRAQREKLDDDIKKREDKYRQREMRDELESIRKLAAEREKALDDAEKKAKEKRDVIANAAGMDQAGDIRSASQQKHADERFAQRSRALRDRLAQVGGDPAKLGRLSNLDKAVLDRMQAEKERDDATAELKKLNGKIDDLSRKLENIATL